LGMEKKARATVQYRRFGYIFLLRVLERVPLQGAHRERVLADRCARVTAKALWVPTGF
jgi:hypothetical protein